MQIGHIGHCIDMIASARQSEAERSPPGLVIAERLVVTVILIVSVDEVIQLIVTVALYKSALRVVDEHMERLYVLYEVAGRTRPQIHVLGLKSQ